jgi:hypothetical protein
LIGHGGLQNDGSPGCIDPSGRKAVNAGSGRSSRELPPQKVLWHPFRVTLIERKFDHRNSTFNVLPSSV